MQLLTSSQCLAIVATLLASVQSAPVTPNDATVLETRSSINDCGPSTFINQSSGGSPKISDCQQIARNIAGGGTWHLGAGGYWVQLAQYGTCAFGARGDGSANVAYIGNQDIIDLINSSIAKFSWNGLVGSKGVMGCQSATGLVGGVDVSWGIYHT